ncbi:MAG: DUF2247 family protein [Eubacteriales bacterium]|nr:DUF2247 family protein [Eubacteriales bacterium]
MADLEDPINSEKLYNIMPNWTWQELAFALNKEILYQDDIILYAKKIISDDTENFDLVLELIIDETIDKYEILEILFKINSYEKYKQDEEEIESKWIFACVYYSYIYDIKNIYPIIEEIWVVFDYTPELEYMIGWKPVKEGEPNFETLPFESRLETYILNGKNKYKLS